jgi:hypothetical protein
VIIFNIYVSFCVQKKIHSLLCRNLRLINLSSMDCMVANTTCIVRELMGWVRNVALIKCIFGSRKPKGGRDFGWEGTWAR